MVNIESIGGNRNRMRRGKKNHWWEQGRSNSGSLALPDSCIIFIVTWVCALIAMSSEIPLYHIIVVSQVSRLVHYYYHMLCRVIPHSLLEEITRSRTTY